MTLIRMLVTYTCDIWTLSVGDMNNLLVFGRQILRKIFKPIQSKYGWSIRSNNEPQKLIKGKCVVKYIKHKE